MNEPWRSRITIEPGKRGGRPCIRGMRITVYDVLSYLAAGMTVSELLDDFPYLTPEDVQACFAFAAERERSKLVDVTVKPKSPPGIEPGVSKQSAGAPGFGGPADCSAIGQPFNRASCRVRPASGLVVPLPEALGAPGERPPRFSGSTASPGRPRASR